MNESEQNQQKDGKKANERLLGAVTASALVAGLGVWGAGSAIESGRVDPDADHNTNIANSNETEISHDSIAKAINEHYEAKDVVGEISVAQDGALIDASENLLKNELGEQVYEDTKGLVYGPLLESAGQYIPQPGEKYTVVKTDLNPAAQDGDEYIVTKPDRIVYTDTDSIPTPETH